MNINLYMCVCICVCVTNMQYCVCIVWNIGESVIVYCGSNIIVWMYWV